jgi:hypothetical protein
VVRKGERPGNIVLLGNGVAIDPIRSRPLDGPSILDTSGLARETSRVFVAGRSQRQIARTLTTAYASGLLSEDTFLYRTDQLLGGGVIDPARLVGDLSLRRTRGRLQDMAAAITSAGRRLSGSSGTDLHRPSTLLALDWTGTQTEMLIGRHRTCDVVLSDLSVSRRHARLRFRDGRWILQDLESMNGTTVNGSSVGRCELRPATK